MRLAFYRKPKLYQKDYQLEENEKFERYMEAKMAARRKREKEGAKGHVKELEEGELEDCKHLDHIPKPRITLQAKRK